MSDGGHNTSAFDENEFDENEFDESAADENMSIKSLSMKVLSIKRAFFDISVADKNVLHPNIYSSDFCDKFVKNFLSSHKKWVERATDIFFGFQASRYEF